MTDDPAAVPRTDRPWMYGRPGLDPVRLPWSWAEHRLTEARSYWIATTRPDGRPHTRPVWGVWRGGGFHFSTGSAAAVNVRSNPEITVHLESGAEVVILEGVVRVTEGATEVIRAYDEKYSWTTDPGVPEPWYEVRPVVAFGWVADPSGRDGGALFHGSTTRWSFTASSGT